MPRIPLLQPILLIVGLLFAPDRVESAEVWLAGVDPFVRHVMEPDSVSDYMDLFSPGAPWSRAAGQVQVFKTSTQWITHATDAELSAMFADLRRRHIALAVAALMLTGNGCGRGVEGYSGPQEMDALAARVRRLEGELSYVAMDEPLWFGHHYNGHDACQSPMHVLAQDVAAKVAAIRRSFPAVRVGDIEPVSTGQPADWVDEIMRWAEAYRSAVGEPLAFFHADVQWAGPWRQQLNALSTRLRAASIKLGIIYNGDADDQTGVAWTRHAEQRFAEAEADPTVVPEQAILQTWMRHPLHMLPEAQAGTMTYLVNRYAAKETSLSLQRQEQKVVGQLTDATSRPVAGARVRVLAVDTSPAGTPIMAHLEGIVPAGHPSALLALRINSECDCAGPADVTIGTARYRDGRSGQMAERNFSATGNTAAANGSRFMARPEQQVQLNTQPFPVTAGDPFTLEVPMRASYASRGSGYVALIFLGQPGQPGERLRVPFEPATMVVGSVTTDTQGRFSILPKPNVQQSNPSFRAEFPGRDRDRPVSAFLP